jgi:hypothetical protein
MVGVKHIPIQIQPGLYQHYKGQIYRVLGTTTHSESQELLVLYQALYGEKGLWSRPLEMFVESVATDNGESVVRFAYLENQTMVLEVATLTIRSEQVDAFLKAFELASPLIVRQPGYIDHQLRPNANTQGEYLLQVVWQTIDDHRIGFRESPDYEKWSALLHHFYEPFPIVEYYNFRGQLL